jgi:hypothetical protein
MNRICAVSPFNCGWIDKTTIAQLGDYSYAVCRRDRYRDRIVNEAECARCPRWEEFEATEDHEAWPGQLHGFRF